jgi:hypothetical protein
VFKLGTISSIINSGWRAIAPEKKRIRIDHNATYRLETSPIRSHPTTLEKFDQYSDNINGELEQTNTNGNMEHEFNSVNTSIDGSHNNAANNTPRTRSDYLLEIVETCGDAIFNKRGFNLTPEQLQIERQKVMQRAEILMTQGQVYTGIVTIND